MKTTHLKILAIVLLFLIFFGGYFAFNGLFKEPILDKENKTSVENKSKLKVENKNNLLDTNRADKSSDKFHPNKTTKNDSYSKKDKVVDQTLSSSLVLVDNISDGGVIMGNENANIEIEITLYDSEKSKLLADYEVEINCNSAVPKTKKIRSNENGVVIFKILQTGSSWFYLYTKDYAVHTAYLGVSFGKNQYTAKLYKGGKLEIRITNTKNKVEGLMAKIWAEKKDWEKDFTLLEKTKTNGIFIFNNAPTGIKTVSFRAKGFLETAEYILNIDPIEITYLEIILIPEFDVSNARKLVFDLGVKAAPSLITITNSKISTSIIFDISEEVDASEKRDLILLYKEIFIVPQSYLQLSIKDQNILDMYYKEYYDCGKEIKKNKEGLFEYPLFDKEENSLAIFTANYVPQLIKIFPDIDDYKIKLVESFHGKLMVKNKENEALVGVIVDYTTENFKSISITDKNGIATLTGLKEKEKIEIKISDKKYSSFNETWAYDHNEKILKTVVINKGYSITGKIKNKGIEIKDAKVLLCQNGYMDYVEKTISEFDGSFTFNNLDKNEYYIKAFHREFGIATSLPFIATDNSLLLELEVIEKISLSIKLIDSNDNPLPNKQINIIHFIDDKLSESKVSNDKGELVFLNLVDGNYRIEINDNKYWINLSSVKIPSDEIIIKAMLKDSRKVTMLMPGGAYYNGELKITEVGLHFSNSISVIFEKEGVYYLDIHKKKFYGIGEPLAYFFEAPGYAIVKMDPIKFEDSYLPKEFSINLVKGEDCKITVTDSLDNHPISLEMVEVALSEKIIIQNLITNNKGEVFIPHLNEKIIVKVKANNYAPYENEFDILQSKEIHVKLIKGGELKGHLEMDKEAKIVRIVLLPEGQQVEVNEDGNFKFNNLMPGDYKIKIYQDGKEKNFYSPIKVHIENEKTLEINLDDYKLE